jgi:hypothetical protein
MAVASFAVYVFVTFVLPALALFALVISLVIAFLQVCGQFLNAPR